MDVQLMKKNEGNSCILNAAAYGHLEMVKWLSEHGCSIHEQNHEKSNCILQASKLGNIETIQCLMEQGCSLQDANMYGTCIMNASIYENEETVIWMLSKGSSISENTIKTTSCENLLKTYGMYQSLSHIYKSKSSRK